MKIFAKLSRVALVVSLLAIPVTMSHSMSFYKTKESAPNVAPPHLATAVAQRYQLDPDAAIKYVKAAFSAAHIYKQDPVLLLAVAGVESSFQEKAKSPVGAVGLMQVMPNVHKKALTRLGVSVYKPTDNIRAGAHVLNLCTERRGGNLTEALQCYNGALRDKKARYATKVKTEHRTLLALAQTHALPR